MIRIGCLAIFILLVGIPAVASRYLSVGGTIGVIVLEGIFLLFVLPKLLKFGFKTFAMRLFMTKSRVLRGATVEVHDVRPTTRPVTRREHDDDEDDDEEEDERTGAPAEPLALPGGGNGDGDGSPRVVAGEVMEADPDDEPEERRRYVLVDFTLTPQLGASKMQFYDPSEILLVPIDAKVNFEDDPTSDDAGSASVEQLRQVDESGAEHELEDKITGPARLRAVFACPDSLQGRVKFRYYFEAFGDLTLP